MREKKREILNNPSFNNFIYTILYNAEFKDKSGLPDKYMKIATNELAVKKFSVYGSKEEKEFILAHLGFEFFYVVVKKGNSFGKLKEKLQEFHYDKKMSMRSLAEAGIFITGDKEFTKLAGFVEFKTHHPNFSLNLELARQGYNINKWGKRLLSNRDIETNEISDSAKRLSRIIRAAERSYTILNNVEHVNRHGMIVLMYLFQAHNNYVDESVMRGDCLPEESNAIFKNVLKKLKEGEYVRNQILGTKRSYTITGLGIKRVNQFLIEVATKMY